MICIFCASEAWRSGHRGTGSFDGRSTSSARGIGFFFKRSVGATQQGILRAVLAEGETVLENCACEPEIQWLCRYMRSMGAKIQGDGTSEIRIQGVKSLSAGCIQVPPDRIVSGTYICAAAITRSQIVLENPPEGGTEGLSGSI